MVPKLDECFSGKSVLFSMEYSLPGIGMRELSVSYSPIEVSGVVETVACVLRDITEMKRIEVVETGGGSESNWLSAQASESDYGIGTFKRTQLPGLMSRTANGDSSA